MLKEEMKTSDFLLSVRDLKVVYTSAGATVHAVNGVSLNIKRGESLGLVGETGAGKTTIAKSILGVLPNPPAKILNGEIILEDSDLLKLPEKEMRKVRGNKISMIFQDPMTALNPLITVGDQIAEVVSLHESVSKKEAMDKAMEMLEMVGIPADRYAEFPHQFSGGMKQRVVIAIALACNPELLLADEPTTALDVTIQAQVMDMISALQKKLNTSMILITHDLGVVAESCDNVAVIYAGQIVEYASKEDLFLDPVHPYTIGLFGSIPSLDKDVKRLTPIPGMPPDPENLPDGCSFHPRCKHATEECKHGDVPFKEVSPNHFVHCHMCHCDKDV
ncbi:MAG: ABC transporter ATP-binding protein [Lacrimispora sp.]|uniref:ABC transporter ATP-binding protein n=1 Tax=Lacrimispora sp. TaxID=2719234 RepID=UPI0039E61DF9